MLLYKNLIIWIRNYYNKLQTLLNKIEDNLYCIIKYNQNMWIVYKKHQPNIQFHLYIPSLYFTIIEPVKGSYFVAKIRSESSFYKILQTYNYKLNILNSYLQFLNIFERNLK